MPLCCAGAHTPLRPILGYLYNRNCSTSSTEAQRNVIVHHAYATVLTCDGHDLEYYGGDGGQED